VLADSFPEEAGTLEDQMLLPWIETEMDLHSSPVCLDSNDLTLTNLYYTVVVVLASDRIAEAVDRLSDLDVGVEVDSVVEVGILLENCLDVDLEDNRLVVEIGNSPQKTVVEGVAVVEHH
jgi:hypothetical protein